MKKILLFMIITITLLIIVLSGCSSNIVADGEFGKNGNNLKWSLNEKGILIITGKGEMESFKEDSLITTPWKNLKVNSIVIKSGVTNISDYAFYGTNAETINIPKTVNKIECTFLDACYEIKDISVDEDNQNFKSIDGVLYDKNISKLIKYPIALNDEKFIIPKTVKIIGERCFEASKYLSVIETHDNITEIQKWAFCYCRNLKNFKVPKSLQKIDAYAFWDCDKISEFAFPDGIKKVEDGTFYSCDTLKSITIPDSVECIGKQAFTYCVELENVFIPKSVTSIEMQAFENCKKLKEIIIHDKIKTISTHAFAECPNLVLLIENNSIAERYAQKENIPYTFNGNTSTGQETVGEVDDSSTKNIVITYNRDIVENKKQLVKLQIKNLNKKTYKGNIYVAFYDANKTKFLGSDTIIIDELLPGNIAYANTNIDYYSGEIMCETEYKNSVFIGITSNTNKTKDADLTNKVKDDFYWNFYDTNWYSQISDIIVYNDNTCDVILTNSKEAYTRAFSVYEIANEYGVREVYAKDTSGNVLSVKK